MLRELRLFLNRSIKWRKISLYNFTKNKTTIKSEDERRGVSIYRKCMKKCIKNVFANNKY